MSTTSTLTTVKRRLVTTFTNALATAGRAGGQGPGTAAGGPVQTSYVWPGPDTHPESVFCGYHPDLRDLSITGNHDIPTIKAGRKQRQENYTVPVTIWEFRPDLDADGAEACEVEAEALFGLLEDALADDVRIGLDPSVVQHVAVGDWDSTLWPFQKGWACAWVFNVDVAARLT